MSWIENLNFFSVCKVENEVGIRCYVGGVAVVVDGVSVVAVGGVSVVVGVFLLSLVVLFWLVFLLLVFGSIFELEIDCVFFYAVVLCFGRYDAPKLCKKDNSVQKNCYL